MRQNAGNILEISISLDSKKKILEDVEKYLFAGISTGVRQTKKKHTPFVIVTPNPEQIVLAQRDLRFRKILNRADVAIPDGIGVVWAARILRLGNKQPAGRGNLQRIPGIELFEDLVAISERRSIRIGLIGGQGNLAVKALECLQARNHNLSGGIFPAPKLSVDGQTLKVEAGTDDTEIKKYTSVSEYVSKVVSWINNNNIAIVFVGLGAPKQEYLIEELVKTWGEEKRTKPVVFMAVGGSFDILAGRIRRAPVFIRLIGFEWLWRLIREPWRLRRQIALLTFSFMVLQRRFVSK